jgi:hypothetical protein
MRGDGMVQSPLTATSGSPANAGLPLGEGGVAFQRVGSAGKLQNLEAVGDDATDLAVHHLDDAVGVLAHAQVMRDHDAGAVLFVNQLGEGLHDLMGALGVEAGGRLVGQDNFRLVDQGAGDGDALLLTAGKLAGTVLEPFAQPQAVEQIAGALATLPVELAVESQQQLDIFLSAEKGHQVVSLERKADVLPAKLGAFAFAHAPDVFFGDDDLAVAGLE